MELFEEMKNKECQPDEYTYNMLIDILCSRGKMEEALSLLQEMELSGCARNVVTYNTLIDGFIKNKGIEEAEEIFDEMELQGVSRNSVTYNTLIDGLCKSKKGRGCCTANGPDVNGRAADVVQTMTSNRCEPDIVTYGTLIGGLCKAALFRWRRTNEAMRLFREMMEKGDPPDAVTYKIVFCGLCSGGRPIQEAVKFVVEMVEKGFLPEFSSFYMLAEGLCALYMEDTLVKLVDMIMKKANCSDSKVSMIRGFLKIHKFEDALTTLGSILDG
ncbi:hypothetical protein SLEP1_g38901 [Rubroshorea leprosula]|uniref:Pentatricopeptide repeat-containing protein n=1 Tax=Rubroshorea leprosula TaxID=152421 RepID=A0AAV5KYV6_9ROSI|nr:hypothetical protein SLEP1_g38901 [Rubroshorea leprosula]